jgi:non-heme chloroperoxidase
MEISPLVPSGTSRMQVSVGATGLMAICAVGLSSRFGRPASARSAPSGGDGRVKTRDGTVIFYKDWGTTPIVLLSHGWPLNADAWEDQLFFPATNGCRFIVHELATVATDVKATQDGHERRRTC